MSCKTFRVDWYPADALIDLSELNSEQRGVYIQLINLIYVRNRSLENDPKYICKHCSMGPKRCRTIIKQLLEKGKIFLTEDQKIMQKRCEKELNNINERRKKRSENGKKGAGERWETDKKQVDKNGDTIIGGMASTNTSQSHSCNTDTSSDGCDQGGDETNVLSLPHRPVYDIGEHLSNSARLDAIENSNGMDQQHLIRVYNKRINNRQTEPPNSPDKAYPAWCKSYTKNYNGCA